MVLVQQTLSLETVSRTRMEMVSSRHLQLDPFTVRDTTMAMPMVTLMAMPMVTSMAMETSMVVMLDLLPAETDSEMVSLPVPEFPMDLPTEALSPPDLLSYLDPPRPLLSFLDLPLPLLSFPDPQLDQQ